MRKVTFLKKQMRFLNAFLYIDHLDKLPHICCLDDESSSAVVSALCTICSTTILLPENTILSK